MKKIIFVIGMLLACISFAKEVEHVGICVPLFGISGTIEGATYTVRTDYIYTPSPYYYYPTVRYPVLPPPPPRIHHRHHHRPPPPPPPHRHHGPRHLSRP